MTFCFSAAFPIGISTFSGKVTPVFSLAETMPSERNPNDNECRRKKYVFIYSANSGEAAGADFRRHNAWWQDFGLYSDELKSLSNVSAACQPPVKIPPVQSFNRFIHPDM